MYPIEEITWIGYPIMFFGVLFFFLSPKRLYEMTVFFVPFSGTAVFYVSGESFQGTWVRVAFFLGTLCLLRHFITLIRTRKIDVSFYFRTPLVLLFVFGAVCMLSLLMPLIIDGKIAVKAGYYGELLSAKARPLHFEIQYLTQALYVLFGCFLAYYIAVENKTSAKLQRSIQVYLNGSFLLAALGIVEIIFYYLDIPFFFSHIFCHGNVNADSTVVLYGSPRITSGAMEPSILSQQLLTALPLLAFQINNWKNFSNQRYLKTCLLTFSIVLVLSTSTTAYIGLLLFVLALLHYKLKSKITARVVVVLLFLGVVIGIVVSYILYKKITTTYSGTERMMSIMYALHWFYKYPVFGVGWATLQVLDLLCAIMGGLGLVGLWSFLLLLFSIYLNFTRMGHVKPRIVEATKYAFIMLLIVSELSGFIFYAQYFWAVLGFTIAASVLPLAHPQSNSMTIKGCT